MIRKKQAAVILLVSGALVSNSFRSVAAPKMPKLESTHIGNNKPPFAHFQGLKKTDDVGDGSAFEIVIPADLKQVITVNSSWLPLSKQLAALQDATQVPLSLQVSVPDDFIYVAAPMRTEFDLLHQMRLLLTDNDWRGQWVSTDLGQEKHTYRLWRASVGPQERRAKMAQAAKERLAYLLALLHAGQPAWDHLRQQDPEMSNGIRQPVLQAPLLLAGELSPEQLDGVLMGQPLTLPIVAMSPQDQALVRQSTGSVPNDNEVMVVQDRAGHVLSVHHYMQDLYTTGNLVFTSTPLWDDPESLGLCVTAYPERDRNSGAQIGLGGDEVLHLHSEDFGDEKQKIEAQHRQEAWDALAAQVPGSKTVTIDAAAKPEPGEPQLAAYLRAFAEQTKLTVLAHWSADSKAPDKKLPASIVGKPAGAALDILCQTYDGEWVQDEKTVRLRALPAKESAPKKPTVAAPTSAPVGSGLSR